MLKHWKKLRSKILFRHPRTTLIEDTVELPDGSQTDYLYFSEPPDSVGVIAIRKDGKILLQRELSYPMDKFLWQFPGGSLRGKESPETGANRELMEEEEYKGDHITIIGYFYVNNRRSKEKQYVAVMHDLEHASLPPDKGEVTESRWVKPQEINRMISHGEITNSTALCIWMIYTSSKQK